MANKNAKLRKPMSSASKGTICLIVLLILTVCASYLSVAGMKLDKDGINLLQPWVPTSGSWVKSLPVEKALIGGNYFEYSYTVPENAAETAVADSVKTIKDRLAQMGENDAAVSEKDGVVRLELREMDKSHLNSVRTLAVAPGRFVFSDAQGNAVLTEKDVDHAEVKVNYTSSTTYSVQLYFILTADGAAKLAENGASYLSVTCDGDSVSSYALVKDGDIVASMGSTNAAYSTASNIAFLKNCGAVDVDLAPMGNGAVKAEMGIVLTVIVIVCAALLVCALLYLVINGKLTGLAGFLAVWCAVMISFFFVATIVVPSVTVLNVGCLVAILLGVVLALYTAVTRTDAVSKQIGEGNTPKQATKLGFKQTAKTVWIAHAAVLAVALILMIFSFTKPIGYCLACGVVASAFSVAIMRLFQACFTTISKKPSLFGKVK